MAKKAKSDRPDDPRRFTGREWTAVLTGRRSLNGEVYDLHVSGSFVLRHPDQLSPGLGVLDLAHELLGQLRLESAGMEISDGLLLHICPLQTGEVPPCASKR